MPDSITSVDARPLLKRRADSIWARADAKRDEIFAHFEQACAAEDVDVLLLKSDAFVQPPWIKYESWTPADAPGVRERSWITVTVQVHPMHTYELLLTVVYEDRGRKKIREGVVDLDAQSVHDIVRALLGRGGNVPPLRQVRQHEWQLWRPRNKVVGLRRDWMQILAPILFLVGLATVVFGIGLLLILCAVGLWIYLARRPHLVFDGGRPTGMPRHLRAYDSWQTVLFGLGRDSDLVWQMLRECFAGSAGDRFTHAIERIAYWGPEGKVQREQLLVRYGRGLLFAQIYPYGDDLYVGWDAHGNNGSWAEKTHAVGMDPKSGRPAKVNSVVPGWSALNEYDLIDLNCLVEWTHAQITKVLKRLAELRKIDQELNFEVIRATRQGVTGGVAPGGGGHPSGMGGFLGRLRRTK